MQDHRKGGGQRWQRWMQQKKIEQLTGGNKEDKLNSFAQKIVTKLNKPFGEVENSLKNELEMTNYCPVCLQMMTTPHKPMMLVPCGHNLCQICLKDGHFVKCPQCKGNIQTSSPNYSLMSLIQKFKDSQMRLAKERESAGLPTNINQFEALKFRCSILETQKNALQKEFDKESKQVAILQTVSKRLFQEKIKVRKEIDTLLAEEQLIQKHIQDNDHRLKLSRALKESVAEKIHVLEKSLQPLLVEKEKIAIFQAEKLIHKS